MAVVVRERDLAKLARVPGVARVWPSFRYHPLLDRTPELIGARAAWGPTLATAGQGMKIGIIDDGVDQSHPFFSPAGFSYPRGYPKGQRAYTTPKVIVARAFVPPTNHWRYAHRPFDPLQSDHATHVAGIAAGDYNTSTGRFRVSGIAPKAWIGNYKALTVPTRGFGLDGNSPEIAAAIEQAVKDGMDVLNLSLGEPEVDPAHDLVVRAIDRAVAAGVVVAVAAGNDYDSFGRGSIGSPGSASRAISAAASTGGHGSSSTDVITDFSSGGPTPVSLQLKPDVTAPGEAVLSSVPKHDGLWAMFEGTSMASPHVAGAAALLLQRHPSWTPDQVKSALVQTGVPVYSTPLKTTEALPTRQGGGRIAITRALDPRLFANPVSLSFGLLPVGSSSTRTTTLADAGGGAGTWSVGVQVLTPSPGVAVTAPASVQVPGTLDVTAAATSAAPQRDVSGFVVLANGATTRRIPFWLRTTSPQLASEPHTQLVRAGTYHGDTTGKPARVTTYRYPDTAPGITTSLPGPEQVFRFHVGRAISNFGVVLLSRGRGDVTPRVVVAGDENRLVGYPGLPIDLNPYLPSYGKLEPIAGAILPAVGDYDIVFDSPSGARTGPFTFRFWIGDSTPPRIRLLTRSVGRGGVLRLALTDAGAGVDPASASVRVDGRAHRFSFSRGRLRIALGGVGAGTHRIRVQASDYQEEKNMENVPRILGNTRVFGASFRVR
jgi:subtilisin family serine protease